MEDRPNFRILAPQVICSDRKTNSAIDSSQISIRMQTKGGQKLQYKVQLFFETYGKSRGQQHSLKIWKTIRALERQININNREIISMKNLININKTELTPGVFYIFNIIGIDENGEISPDQNFTLAFNDGQIQRLNPDGTIIPDDITFLLLGAEITYADMEYTIEARISFCEQRFDYYMNWTMINLNENYKRYLEIPGNILKIPAYTLRGAEKYVIEVKALQSNDSSVIIYSSIELTVLKRYFTVFVIPENIMIGLNRQITIKLEIIDHDNTGIEPNISWSCLTYDDANEIVDNDVDGIILRTEATVCDNFNASDNNFQKLEFYKKGRYLINVTVIIGTVSKSQISSIIVHPDVIAIPQIKNFNLPLKTVASGQNLQIDATINYLVPNCMAQWTVLNLPGYEYFNISKIPVGLGNLTILDMEEIFLSELIEYGNSTLSRDIQLNIPSNNTYSEWEGLTSNSKYKFRLLITCPIPMDEENFQKLTNITSYLDITIQTNQSPIGQLLDVTPKNGTALRTVFRFITGSAIDDQDGYPLKYTFKFITSHYTFKIGEYFENFVSTTQLPFSNQRIKTMYEVCNSRLACSIQVGPDIETISEPLNENEFNNIIIKINSSFIRMEYNEGFNYVIMSAISFNNSNNIIRFNTLQMIIQQLIDKEIDRLCESLNLKYIYYVAAVDIVNFVKLTKTTISVLQLNEQTISKLSQLFDLLINEKKYSLDDIELKLKKRRKRENSILYERNNNYANIKRNGATTIIDKDYILTSLELSESLLKSKNNNIVLNEKKHVTEKIHIFMEKLCINQFNSDIFTNSFYIHTNIVSFELHKLNLNQLLSTNFTIPFVDCNFKKLAYFTISANNYVNANQNEYCIGKIRYPSDYLTGSTKELFTIFIKKIVDDENMLNKRLENLENIDNIQISLPLHENDIGNYYIECQIWKDNNWSSYSCTTTVFEYSYIHCSCNRIGYFRYASPLYVENEMRNNTIQLEYLWQMNATSTTIWPEEITRLFYNTTTPTSIREMGFKNYSIIIRSSAYFTSEHYTIFTIFIIAAVFILLAYFIYKYRK